MSDLATRRGRVGPRQLLTRILEQPRLPEVIRALPAPALGRLVDHLGLEDAGELLALCTTAQVERLLDEDLWRSRRPGEEERYDPERFARWLEVMMDAGEEACARRLAELPEDLVAYALHRQAMVVDLDALALEVAERGGDDQLEKALDSALAEELDQYRVIARRADGWDALVGVLTVLDRDHHDLLVRLLERCAAATADQVEEQGGLLRALSSEESLEADAAADREDRRAREGYVSPASAAAFLRLARTTSLDQLLAQRGPDPITRAYFREYRPAPLAPSDGEVASPGLARSVEALLDELGAAGVIDPGLPLQLAGEAPSASRFRLALAALRERDPALHARRLEELSYLANLLLAGCAHRGRPYRPAEAAEAAMAVCEVGLSHRLGERGSAAAVDLVLREEAPFFFRLGCCLLGGADDRELARRISALLPPG